MKITFSVLSFFSILFCFGQTNSLSYEEKLLDKAYTIENVIGYTSLDLLSEQTNTLLSGYAKETKRQILSNAIEYYDTLIDSFPNSKLIYRAIIGKAFINYENEEYQKAKEGFLKINNAKDSLNSSSKNNEAFTRFRIAINLAEIAVMDKEYENALVYLESSKNHKLRYMCLNAYYDDHAKYNYLKAKAYLGLNDYKKAYSVLLPNIFESGCFTDTGIPALAVASLQKNYSKTELKIKFEKAFQEYHIEKDKTRKKLTRFYILFLDEKIYIPYYEDKETSKKERAEGIKKALANSKFYNILVD